jgi:hypothetical protein
MLEADGHLVLVLHAPPTADETARRGRFFWRAPDGAWRAAPKAERVATLEQHLGEYRAAIEQLEQAEDAARRASDYFELLDRLAPLTRAMRHLHETLQQAREAVREDRLVIVARDRPTNCCAAPNCSTRMPETAWTLPSPGRPSSKPKPATKCRSPAIG